MLAGAGAANTVISNNTVGANGGGISNYQGTVTITSSTVSGNTAERRGGGIANISGNFTGALTVTNSTISGNRAGAGGGIRNSSAIVHLQNVTIANNTAPTGTGGGIENTEPGTFTLRNTLIAGNTTGLFGPDCYALNSREAALQSQGYNLIQNITNCDISGDATGNITGQDPKLGALTNNGGPTPTHALLAGSPAINTGNSNPPGSGGFACTTIDQRGILRPQGTACDIGAYETETFQGAALFIVPNHGGNTGSILAVIYGSDVVNGATVKLARADQDIVGNPVAFAGTSVLSTSFDLAGKPTGAWDVVVTKPDGTSATIPGGFTVEDTRAPQLWADVIGRTDRIRIDRPERYTMLFGVRGNVDAVAASLVLTIPADIGLNLRFQVLPPPPQAGQVSTDWSQVPINPVIDGLTYVPLFLPVVPAGFTGTLEFTVTPPSARLGIPFEIRAEIGLASLDSLVALLIDGARSYAQQTLGVSLPLSLNPQLQQYITNQLQNAVAHSRNTAVMSANTSPEVYSLPQLVVDLAQFGAAQTMASTQSVQGVIRVATDRPLKTSFLSFNRISTKGELPTISTAVPFAVSLSMGEHGVLPQPANAPGSSGLFSQPTYLQPGQTQAQATGWVSSIARWVIWLFQPNEANAQSFESCSGKGQAYDPRRGRCIPNGCQETSGRNCGGGGPKPNPSTSGDPNDKVVSLGVGPDHYLAGAEPLRYAIFFENMKTADLPAQVVVITDQLDGTRVDFETFSLGPITFGDTTVNPPPGLSQYSTSLDLRPKQNLLVAIQAWLEKSSGLVTWGFISLDPGSLQLTEDPTAGFLPPNTNPPEGEGNVFFTVKPRQGLPAGTQICNQASIVFDVNERILTPERCNTVDYAKPTSGILALGPTQTSSNFQVQWSGTDEGSGILDYSVFVSQDGGPFAPLLSNTTETSTTFTGIPNSTYAFYSVARDLTGNVEDPPTVPDATTQVILAPTDSTPPTSTALVSPAPNGAGWIKSDATVTLGADDDPGGSGVKQLTYSASGAHTIGSTTVSGASASIPITAEGETTITFFATDNAGNVETAKSVVVKLDKTPPTISGSRTPAPNAAGWNNTDVTVSFSCADGLSGIGSCGPTPQVVSTQGAGQSRTGTAADKAGNSASATEGGINIDKTKPASQVLPLAANQSTPSFQVQWAGTDGGSGLLDYSVFVSENGGPFTPFLSNTPATSATFTGQRGRNYAFYTLARDQAGNAEDLPASADAVTLVLADTTPPVVTANVSPAPNGTGWNKSDVTATWSVSDPESGIASSTGCGSTTVTTETAGTTLTCTATNGAGVSSSRSVTVKIDKTLPALACSVSPNTLWPPNQRLVPVTASVRVTDALSGPGSFTLLAVTSSEAAGGPGDGNSPADIQGFTVGTPGISGLLRAERAGSGTGRLYTLTYQGLDGAGNAASCNALVTVPHDQGK